MSLPTTVSVECYSGHTYADRPVAFVWRDRRHKIEQISKQWRTPKGLGFRVVVTGGEEFELFYVEAQDEWFLLKYPTAIADTPKPSSTRADQKE